MKSSDAYVPLDYELLVRGEGEEFPRVVYDTYSFGMTVPQYNLELFQSGEVVQFVLSCSQYGGLLAFLLQSILAIAAAVAPSTAVLFCKEEGHVLTRVDW